MLSSMTEKAFIMYGGLLFKINAVYFYLSIHQSWEFFFYSHKY